MNYTVYSLVFYSKTGINAFYCKVNNSAVKLLKNQICCNNTIYLKREDSRVRDCCGGNLYFLDESICCEQNIFPKFKDDGTEYQCCGPSPFYFSATTKCCNDIRLDSKENERCCGSGLIDDSKQKCCELQNGTASVNKRHRNWKCCGLTYYNSSTYWCDNRHQTVRLLHQNVCGSKQYDMRYERCCHTKLHRGKTDQNTYGCCGTEVYDKHLHKCCFDNFTIPQNMRCCKGSKTGIHPGTQLCCGIKGIPRNKRQAEDRCCGEELFNSVTEICCNNPKELPQIKEKSYFKKCSHQGKCSTVNNKFNCCGYEGIDNDSVCCLNNTLQGQNHFLLNKSKRHHDKCCASPTTNYAASYFSDTHKCLAGKIIKNYPLCGTTPYNQEEDLCCSGELYLGRAADAMCCGAEISSTSNQTCCNFKVVNATRCPTDGTEDREDDREDDSEENEIPDVPVIINSPDIPYEDIPCLVICTRDEQRTIREIRKRHLPFCKLYAYKVIVGKPNPVGSNTYFRVKKRGKNFLTLQKRRDLTRPKVKKVFLPCYCKHSERRLLVLTDKKVSNSRLRLTENDLLIPYTPKIRKKLKKIWRRKCTTPTSLVTEELIEDIFDLIKIKIWKQRQAINHRN